MPEILTAITENIAFGKMQVPFRSEEVDPY